MAKKNEYADRAKQFIPFDALKGFRMALQAKEKVTADRWELSEDQKEEIDSVLRRLQPAVMVKAEYYSENGCLQITGLVTAIDAADQTLRIVKTVIRYEDIVRIQIISGIKEGDEWDETVC